MFPVNSLSMAAPTAVRLDGKAAAALAALSASAFAYVTAENLPVGLLPELEAGLGRSPAQIGALVTAYGAVIVVLSIPLTRAARGLDRRLLLSGLLAAFALLTLASGVAPGYDALLSARVATAASQAVFWSLVVPTAAALVPAELRGRAMSLVFGGASVGVVVGVPAGTWLGQVGGWRLPFLALGGVGLMVAFSLLRLLPDARAGSSHEPGGADAPVPAPSPGGQPSVRAYAVLAVVTVLGTGGAFIGYTYITTFLGQVTHLSASSAGPALLARGVAGLVGVAVGGMVIDRFPGAALSMFVALQAAAMAGLAVFGTSAVVAVTLWALTGLAFSGFSTALASRLLVDAPGDPALASAGISTAVNVGITVGALAGGLLVGNLGARSTVVVGSILSVAAVATRRLATRPSRVGRAV